MMPISGWFPRTGDRMLKKNFPLRRVSKTSEIICWVKPTRQDSRTLSIHLYQYQESRSFLMRIKAFLMWHVVWYGSQVETENWYWDLVIYRFREVNLINFGCSGRNPNRLVEPTGRHLFHSIISSCWVDMGRVHSLDKVDQVGAS